MSTRPPWPNKHTQYAVTTQCPNWSDCNIYLALKFIQNPVLLCEKSHINKKVNTLHHCLHNSHWHQFSKALGSRSQWIQCSTKITMMSYELRFYIPTQHKIGHYGNVPQANLSTWYGKTKPNTTKAHSPIKRNVLQHKINTKKLKPGLVAAYDIRPGNGEGLFWFWHFINLSPSSLLTHLHTYTLTLSPGTHMGQALRSVYNSHYEQQVFSRRESTSAVTS